MITMMNRETLIIVFAVTLCVMCALEYFVCLRSTKRAVRLLPAVWPLFSAGCAVYMIIVRPLNGDWFDLSGLFALLFAVYAAVSLLGMLGGYILSNRHKGN